MCFLASADTNEVLALLFLGAAAVSWYWARKEKVRYPCWRCNTVTRASGGDYVCPKCGWTFEKDGRFRIPVRSSPISACRLRRYCETDFEACVDIYRLNEPGRFPSGAQYLQEFQSALRDGRTLFIVCEVDGKVRGCGGVSVVESNQTQISLSYGLVHPFHHGKGLGTALLLGRLSLLPKRQGHSWIASMATVEASAPFYARFGFSGRKIADELGSVMWSYSSIVDAAAIGRCREMLDRNSVEIECAGAAVPVSKSPERRWSEVNETQ